MCSHKIKTQARGQQNKSPAMCKTGHGHAANENTHKRRVHTRHDNMKACSPWKTQAACHTAQDITWMHTADKTRTAFNNKNTTHLDRRARGVAEWTRDRMLTKRDRTCLECPKPVTKPKLKTWVPGSVHLATTQNKARTARAKAVQLIDFD